MHQQYDKLIRDKIPEIIKKDGERAITRILDDEEFKEELTKKLVEESSEVVEAGTNKSELTKEIGDVLEVIESIIRTFKLDQDEIDKMKKERREKRGSFDKKIFLEYTE